MSKIGFIGLGIMGRPMAGHLLEAGHELVTYVKHGTLDEGPRWRPGGIRRCGLLALHRTP